MADHRANEQAMHEAQRTDQADLERAMQERIQQGEQSRRARTARQDAQAERLTASPALRCRCGSTAFGVPQIVELRRSGETLEASPIPIPDTVAYSCMSCGDTGTLERLKGRLDD